MLSNDIVKVICIQSYPKLSKIEQNIEDINQLLKKYDKSDLDIIILPEMCLTGYVFDQAKDVHVVSEVCGQGNQFKYFQSLALKHSSYVFAGYPEKGDDGKYYNSLYCIDRDGSLILNYRKTFLYIQDKLYFTAGEGFKTLNIKTKKGKILKTAPCICMDMNSSSDETFFDYEFATFCQNNKIDLIIFCMNWLVSEGGMDLFNYWAMRMTPVITQKPQNKNNVHFLGCNRIGIENNTTFTGLTFHMTLNPLRLILRLETNKIGVLSTELKY